MNRYTALLCLLVQGLSLGSHRNWAQEPPLPAIAVRGELLLHEDFQSQPTYSKTKVPLKPGWSIYANHAEWVRSSAGVKSVYSSGHMPVLKLEGAFDDCIIEVDFRYEPQEGRWGGCRISTGNSELAPRAYTASVWANQSFDGRARGLVLEQDQWKPGFITTVDRKSVQFEPDRWYTLRLEIVGHQALASCNGAQVSGAFDKFALPKTSLSLGVGTCTHELRNLRIYRALPLPKASASFDDADWVEILPQGDVDRSVRSYIHFEDRDKNFWETPWKTPGSVSHFVERYEYDPDTRTETFTAIESQDNHRRVEYRGPDYETGTYRFQGELLIDDNTTDDVWVMQLWHAVLIKYRHDSGSGTLTFHPANSATGDARVGIHRLASNMRGKRVKLDVIHSGAPEFDIAILVSVDGEVQNGGLPYRFKTFDADGNFYIKYGAYCGPGQQQTVRWINTHIWTKK